MKKPKVDEEAVMLALGYSSAQYAVLYPEGTRVTGLQTEDEAHRWAALNGGDGRIFKITPVPVARKGRKGRGK